MRERAKVIIKTRVSLGGKVNGRVISLHGRGLLQPQKGITQGRYVIENLPKGFHARLLGAMLITGYPESSKALAGAQNPFANTSNRYVRLLDFGKLGKLVLRAECLRDRNTIKSTFRVSGRVKVPPIAYMEPLIETWIPAGRGRILGHFVASWVTTKGNRISAHCYTDYRLAKPRSLKSRQHRFATFRTDINGNRMAKHQVVSLFRDFPQHNSRGKPPLDFMNLEEINKNVERQAKRLA